MLDQIWKKGERLLLGEKSSNTMIIMGRFSIFKDFFNMDHFSSVY